MAFIGNNRLKELVGQGVIRGTDPQSIGPISIDLHTNRLIDRGHDVDELELAPGASIMVETVEHVNLPLDAAALIRVRNTVFRRGLWVEAPVYMPGHDTVLSYRLVNHGRYPVRVDRQTPLAQLFLLSVEDCDRGYSGRYQGEARI